MFILINNSVRARAKAAIDAAPEGHVVRISEPKRNLEQSAKFHAICGDIAKSGYLFMGKPRSAETWKLLLISGHAAATKQGAEVVAGIEGEWLNIRESTALMGVKRMASLIEYAIAWCVSNGILLRD